MEPTSFLSELVMELENMAEAQYAEPRSAQGTDDFYIGVMSEHLKKLYTLRDIYNRKRAELIASAITGDIPRDAGSCTMMSVVERKFLIADSLMWLDIHTEFPEAVKRHGAVALCKGYRVVILNEHE
jgi:hypothetical protein